MSHHTQRLTDRPFTQVLTVAQIAGLCVECDEDTAVIVAKHDQQHGQTTGDYHSRTESNGEYIILIIRNHKAVTTFYRRSNQPMTPTALRVANILDLTQ